MRTVDAQIHLWGSGLPSNLAHRQVTAFTTAEAVSMMNEAGVDAAVIHPPPWDPGATQMALAAVRDHPRRFAILDHLALDPPDPARVARWRSQPGMLGLRYLFLKEPMRSWLEGDALDWLWAAAEKAGVPIAMMATHSLPHVGRIAARHPGLRLTIDHLGGLGGNTTLKDDAAMTHIPELLALARHPNVAVKATGAPGYSSGPYPFRSMHTYLRQIFDAFGPERMFWGTDITKMPCSWRQCITTFTEELPWLRGPDLEQVMGRAVCRWWGWNSVPPEFEDFWAASERARSGLDRSRFLEAFAFGDNEYLAGLLTPLVLSGAKRATASLVWTYEVTGKPKPKPGDLSIVTSWAKEPLCIIQTTEVAVVPFEEVSEDFARAEGEDDGTLASWRKNHMEFYGRECARIGRTPSPRMPVLCEHFRVVFQPGR
jgi:uncharacterized protein YhfF/predicted TIM-barrel fold metal-dependent hydrolase